MTESVELAGEWGGDKQTMNIVDQSISLGQNLMNVYCWHKSMIYKHPWGSIKFFDILALINKEVSLFLWIHEADIINFVHSVLTIKWVCVNFFLARPCIGWYTHLIRTLWTISASYVYSKKQETSLCVWFQSINFPTFFPQAVDQCIIYCFPC